MSKTPIITYKDRKLKTIQKKDITKIDEVVTMRAGVV